MSKIHIAQVNSAPRGVDMTLHGDRIGDVPIPALNPLLPVSNYVLRAGIWIPQDGAGEEALNTEDTIIDVDLNINRPNFVQVVAPLAVPYRACTVWQATAPFEMSFYAAPLATQIYPYSQNLMWPNRDTWKRQFSNGIYVRNVAQGVGSHVRFVVAWRP